MLTKAESSNGPMSIWDLRRRLHSRGTKDSEMEVDWCRVKLEVRREVIGPAHALEGGYYAHFCHRIRDEAALAGL